MTKKLISILLAVILLAAVMMPQPACAETVNGQTVIFTILNNDLKPLSYYTMPYISGGVMYVPYSDFIGLGGISYIYNTKDNILILSNSKSTLFFEISNKIAYDKSNTTLDFKAITYNGQIYLPAEKVCAYFGLLYYYSSANSVIRIKDMNSYYSDRVVVTGFLSDMEKALTEYQEEAARKAAEEEKVITPFDIYLVYEGIDENTSAAADHLLEKKLNAVFFMSENDIRENPELVRRLYVDGFTIGIKAGDQLTETPAELIENYRAANELLLSMLHAGTRLVMIPGGGRQDGFTQEYADAIRAEGYRYWDSTLASDPGLKVSERMEKLEKVTYDIRDNAVFLCNTDADSLSLLDQYLKFCQDGGCHVKNITEFTTPVNLRADKW